MCRGGERIDDGIVIHVHGNPCGIGIQVMDVGQRFPVAVEIIADDGESDAVLLHEFLPDLGILPCLECGEQAWIPVINIAPIHKHSVASVEQVAPHFVRVEEGLSEFFSLEEICNSLVRFDGTDSRPAVAIEKECIVAMDGDTCREKNHKNT